MSVALPAELILSLRSRFKCPARSFCRPRLRVSPLALRAVHTLCHARFVRVVTPLHGCYSYPLEWARHPVYPEHSRLLRNHPTPRRGAALWRISFSSQESIKNSTWDVSTTVNLLTWMIVILSVWAPTMNTQAWMDGLSTALAS